MFFFDMEAKHATLAFRQIYNLPDKTVHHEQLLNLDEQSLQH